MPPQGAAAVVADADEVHGEPAALSLRADILQEAVPRSRVQRT